MLSSLVPVRTVWLSLLRSLDNARAPDLPPHVLLASIDGKTLREIVTRAARGYKNWNSVTGPEITREVVVKVAAPLATRPQTPPGGASVPTPEIMVSQLLPGGEYMVILWDDFCLQCWHIDGNECLWSYIDAYINAFDCQIRLVEGTLLIDVLIMSWDRVHDYS